MIMRLVLDGQGVARGIVIMDLFNLKLSVLKADAVIATTGGIGVIFKKSTNSTFCTAAANGRLFKQGMKYANGEFIAMGKEISCRLLSSQSYRSGLVQLHSEIIKQ